MGVGTIRRYHEHLATAPQLMPITGEDMQEALTLGPRPLPPVVALGNTVSNVVISCGSIGVPRCLSMS